jgi:hypothetical protein
LDDPEDGLDSIIRRQTAQCIAEGIYYRVLYTRSSPRRKAAAAK